MQRAVPKTHDKAMENLDQKLEAKQEAIKKAEKELKHAKKVAANTLLSNAKIFVLSISLSIQAAKNGGDRAEHDKKKKAVQKWVLCRCHPEMLLLSLPVNCELFSFG